FEVAVGDDDALGGRLHVAVLGGGRDDAVEDAVFIQGSPALDPDAVVTEGAFEFHGGVEGLVHRVSGQGAVGDAAGTRVEAAVGRSGDAPELRVGQLVIVG
ncbi:hypothetical protein RZS08_60040, partial [Arthrospira platensis SPKY1]|nr:hypothetical protein [Arthrospira platensis SPKY1]